MQDFNEATRVQIPGLVHLTRIGYTYFGKISEEDAGTVYDPDTNILIDVFKKKFGELNPGQEGLFNQTLQEIRQELDYNDLGKQFYKRLKAVSPIRLIDFDHIEKNDFHCTAEFTCKNGQDEFRPDITLFVNGLPLCFIEVKKPNNREGIVAERRRMYNKRFPNRKFRRFINITQLMLFSNNMEYKTLNSVTPVQGVFYCTGAKQYAPFNCFREENPHKLAVAPYNEDFPYKPIDPIVEKKILSDFNVQVLHHAPEYQTNLKTTTPTNRVLTSMCSPERLLYIIRYGIAYIYEQKEDKDTHQLVTREEKHIMRYPQLFAAQAVTRKIDKGIRSGVIWHTQGSGKTALSYYLTFILTDYFANQKPSKVAKFYFIVDRLDLMEQATQEFEARGLKVTTAQSRKELMEQFRTNQSQEGTTGQAEICVVNIQRFEEDKQKVDELPYSTNLQRIFIMDEAHRGYRPGGSFLANLFDADKNSIKIALTGTPLLAEEASSSKVFGTYYHTYYYDQSIADGYTLRITREDIETSYREKLTATYEKLEQLVLKKEIKKSDIIEHETYVKELLRFIIRDIADFRLLQGNNSLGGMVICETSEQARQLFKYFDEVQAELNQTYQSNPTSFKANIILYDTDDKETRKQIVYDFKKNMTVDILIVFNMLLTGFDAPRLKRLYFGRKLDGHNLLQAITRVNRPYMDMQRGFVIDFADIKENFKQTNAAYLKELNRFNNPIGEADSPDITDTFTHVIDDPDSLVDKMKEVQDLLFNYTTDNVEEFCTEISTEEDKQILQDLKQALITARDTMNVVRTFGDEELKEKMKGLSIANVPDMIREVQRQIDAINQKEALTSSEETKMMINEAMMNIEFKFNKIGTEEMKIIDGGAALKEKWNRAIQEFTENPDPDDPEYITLKEALMARCKEHGFMFDTVAKYNEETKIMDDIIQRLLKIQQRNKVLLKKYNGDAKFARVHKRVCEENAERKKQGKSPLVTDSEISLMAMLTKVKSDVDQKVYDRNDILKKDAYFEQTVGMLIYQSLVVLQIKPQSEDMDFVKSRISRQYLNQYNATYAIA